MKYGLFGETVQVNAQIRQMSGLSGPCRTGTAC